MAVKTTRPSSRVVKKTVPSRDSAPFSIPKFSQQQILYVLLLVATFLVGYLLATVQQLKTPAPKTDAGLPSAPQAGGQPAAVKVTLDQVKKAVDKAVIKFGKSDSANVVIESADPSCPYCHAAAGKNPELSKQMGPQFSPVSEGGTYVAPVPELKKLLDEGKISYSYIYFPGHGSGEMGMKAFYCGFDNGKFWEVHDLLMTNKGYDLLNNEVKNDKTKSQELADFLQPAIDPSLMKSCLDSGKYDTTLKDETTLSAGIGTSGTPTYIVNDTVKVGALSFTDLRTYIK